MPGCFHASEHLMRELALPDCACHSTASPAIETLICDCPDSTEQRQPCIVMEKKGLWARSEMKIFETSYQTIQPFLSILLAVVWFWQLLCLQVF